MRSRSIFTAVGVIVSACAPGEKSQPSADTAAASASVPRPADTRPSDTLATPSTDSTRRWIVGLGGVGPVRVGMTELDLQRVAGDFPPPKAGAPCAYVHPATMPPGVLVMLAGGRVARIDIDSTGVRTDVGVGVGDSTARVAKAYPGRVTITPHKYVAGGQYLTARGASAADSSLRLVFETDSGHVTRFRTGRIPEVEWVERCG